VHEQINPMVIGDPDAPADEASTPAAPTVPITQIIVTSASPTRFARIRIVAPRLDIDVNHL
jgi:hypothetical protein